MPQINVKDAKMRGLIVSTFLSLVCAVPVAAGIAEQTTRRATVQDQVIAVLNADGQKADEDSTQSIEQTLITRLTSAGLTEIEIVPFSFVARAKNADGKPVTFVLYPDANLEWQVDPVNEDDTSPSTHK
jgi:hypothetical protein